MVMNNCHASAEWASEHDHKEVQFGVKTVKNVKLFIERF
jgi:hypothetical protein